MVYWLKFVRLLWYNNHLLSNQYPRCPRPWLCRHTGNLRMPYHWSQFEFRTQQITWQYEKIHSTHEGIPVRPPNPLHHTALWLAAQLHNRGPHCRTEILSATMRCIAQGERPETPRIGCLLQLFYKWFGFNPTYHGWGLGWVQQPLCRGSVSTPLGCRLLRHEYWRPLTTTGWWESPHCGQAHQTTQFPGT